MFVALSLSRNCLRFVRFLNCVAIAQDNIDWRRFVIETLKCSANKMATQIRLPEDAFSFFSRCSRAFCEFFISNAPTMTASKKVFIHSLFLSSKETQQSLVAEADCCFNKYENLLLNFQWSKTRMTTFISYFIFWQKLCGILYENEFEWQRKIFYSFFGCSTAITMENTEDVPLDNNAIWLVE